MVQISSLWQGLRLNRRIAYTGMEKEVGSKGGVSSASWPLPIAPSIPEQHANGVKSQSSGRLRVSWLSPSLLVHILLMDKKRPHGTLTSKGANTPCSTNSCCLTVCCKDTECETFWRQRGPDVKQEAPVQHSSGNADLGSCGFLDEAFLK